MLAAAPTGLYGHVEENRKRSLLLFGGFIVAIELMAFVLLVGPTLIYDWSHNPLVSPTAYLGRYALPVAAAGLLVYAAKLWWFVGSVQKSVGFRYVDNYDEPRFCRILEPLAIAAGITTPYAAVIDSTALNAFACGVRANHMVVVATRGLIDGLDDEELAAVLAHEVMHIKNRDTFLLASANTFMATLLLAQRRRKVALDDWRQAIAMVLLPILIPLVLLIAFMSEVALRIGYCSRAAIGSAREYIADAEAVRLTKNPAAMVSALRKIEGRSRIGSLGQAEEAMMIDGPVEGPLATHPTVTERIAALARTTGSLVFDTGTRLDTRAEPLARAAKVQAFGKRDQELARIATLAHAPPRATLLQIFRKTRDPERNIFGFNRRSTIVFGSTLAAIALIGSTAPGGRLFAAQGRSLYLMADVGKFAKTLASCDLKALHGPLGDGCNPKDLDRVAHNMNATFGLPADSGGTFSNSSGRSELIEWRLRRRCYADRFEMTPAALSGPPTGASFNQSLSSLRRGAQQSNDRLLEAQPGPVRDKALKEYVELRKLLLNDALYFFGKAGLDELNQLYMRDDHQRIIAMLGERLKDPGFINGETESDIADYRLFAVAPFEALPCDVAPVAPARTAR